MNVLVHAFRDASPDHAACRQWLEATITLDEPFGLSELVLSGFVRVATRPRVFDPPAPVAAALAFAAALRSQAAERVTRGETMAPQHSEAAGG